MMSLTEIFLSHQGKLSDRLSSTIAAYEQLFIPYRGRPVRILEIGIQNGGSLDIWAKFFPNAVAIVGCDIHEKCRYLEYDDDRISVVVGDVNELEIYEQITAISPEFDIVIDDGSHVSGDIIRAFARFFPIVAEGGMFVAEDLHCSYWADYEGGLQHPGSSLSFFRRLTDLPNKEFWGGNISAAENLAYFAELYDCKFDEEALLGVSQVSFWNSLAVVFRSSPQDRRLGLRVVVGQDACVNGSPIQYAGTLLDAPDQSHNTWGPAFGSSERWLSRRFDVDRNLVQSERTLKQTLAELKAFQRKFDALEARMLEIFSAAVPILRRPVRSYLTARVAKLAARAPWLSERRRQKFLRSSMKRDPRALGNVMKNILRDAEIEGGMGLITAKNNIYGALPAPATTARLARRILVIAELSIPQCTKYRVVQKVKAFEALGYGATVVSWHDHSKAMSLLQTHTLVLFYRVPGTPGVLALFDEAQRLSIPAGYDIDDLIFDVEKYRSNKNLERLSRGEIEGLLHGARLYRQAIERADFNVASTPHLCALMSEVNGGPSFLVENALDAETIEIAETVKPKKNPPKVRIFYGSGSKTHDLDFKEASGALADVLTRFPDAEILILGDLKIPEDLKAFGVRVQHLKKTSYEGYLAELASCDVAIAPLVDVEFNHAKSNIKFLEAASVGVPAVCSPRSAFADAIEDGVTGFLAQTEQEWSDKLGLLCSDAALRQKMGQAAKDFVFKAYGPEGIRDKQIRPLIGDFLPASDTDKLKVLMVNVFYRPQSFGGATLLVENLVPILKDQHEIDVSVFTTGPGKSEAAQIFRREVSGDNVFRFGRQQDPKWTDTDSPEACETFEEVVRAVRPDVVHFHSIQGFGSGLTDVCIRLGVPYCVTLHDAWWVCARQFLVKRDGTYCGQTAIDHRVCDKCIRLKHGTAARGRKLMAGLAGAESLLTPSRFWLEFHAANGVPKDKLVHCENGIEIPEDADVNAADGKVRFAFFAGTEAVKGFPQLREAFNATDRRDWSLTLIDHGRSLSGNKLTAAQLGIKGDVTVVPPFNAETREAFFNSFDVLLFPSQWPESFGLTVREALVRNKWVISTNLGGQAEAIIDGTNGTLVPIEGGADALRKAIEDVLDKKESLRGWKNPTSPTIRRLEEQADQLADIYSAIARKERKRSLRLAVTHKSGAAN